ncbi:membrane protein insertase YidC [candidate division WOR-3 bacterium]|nr:membrane protein insertase YidC [candidate division WOR-3 bacterium]
MDYKLRIILAIVVSFIVLVSWQFLFNKDKKNQTQAIEDTASAQTTPTSEIETDSAFISQNVFSDSGADLIFTRKPVQPQYQISNENLTINLDLLRGASVAQIKLHDYGMDGDEANLILFPLEDETPPERGLVFTLTEDSSAKTVFCSDSVPFALETAFVESDTQTLVFSQKILRVKNTEFDSLVSDSLVQFSFSDTTEEEIFIKYSLPPKGYSFQVACWTDFNSRMRFSWNMSWLDGMAVTEEDGKVDPAKNRFFIAMNPTGFRYFRKSLKDIAEGKEEYKDPAFWAGVADQYFMMAFIPRNDDGSDFYSPVEFVSYAGDDSRHDYETNVSFGPIHTDTAKFICYTGPLDETQLSSTGFHLDENVQMGWRWLRPISKVLLWFLRLLNRFIPNYGLDIIIFSFAMNVVFLPLSLYSQKSMKRMQDLQPKLQVLKEKHKGDPKKLNEETMKLYRQEAFNPFSGCLPLLLQMPVFMSLYQIMRTTIILRNQSFLWIPDLSAPEATIPISLPFTSSPGIGILPLLMGAMMFIQQKMTNTNPQQKTLTYIMPVFMTYIFLGFPSAIVLYWASYNLFGLIQQFYFKYREKAKKTVE